MTPAKIPPGPKGLPLVGNMFQYLRDPLGFVLGCARDYGDVVFMRLGGAGSYMFNHPEQIEYVLRTHAKQFSKDKWTRMIMSLVGSGLITSEGEFWRRQRQMTAPAFQLHQIERYGKTMVELTEQMLATWAPGQTRDIHTEMMQLTLKIVCKALFTTDVESVAREVGAAVEVAAKHFVSPFQLPSFLQWLPTPGQIRYRRAVQQLHRIIDDIIRKRRDSKAESDDLLSRLLAARDEAGQAMTDQQLRDEIITLFLAGHETTALTLTYSFYLLGQHPEALTKLEAEVDTVLAGRLPTAQDAPKLVFADWVVKESLRLYPPAWSVGREALQDCEIGGYPIPKGAQILIAQWAVHRDPRWFTDPEAFRPERWENDLAKRLPRDAYFPFGDGPRVCIGNFFATLEAVLLMSTIAQRFHLTLVPGQSLDLLPSITIRPKGAVNVVLHSRRA